MPPPLHGAFLRPSPQLCHRNGTRVSDVWVSDEDEECRMPFTANHPVSLHELSDPLIPQHSARQQHYRRTVVLISWAELGAVDSRSPDQDGVLGTHNAHVCKIS